MSRIGKMPIEIPKEVKVDIKDKVVTVTGPKGSLNHQVPQVTDVIQKDNILTVSRKNEERVSKALHGLTRALLNNMVKGVFKGFKKELEIIGVGYKAQMKGKNILGINIGFSHPVDFFIPNEIKASVDAKTNLITLEGCDKQLVGELAAQIRKLRSPEPYKGKGIRYLGEVVKRKAGKAIAGK